MLHSTLRSLAATAALVATAFAATPASANILVDFEGAFASAGPGQPDASFADQGVRFTPQGGDAFIGEPFPCDPAVSYCVLGNSSSQLSAYNDATVTITLDGGYGLTLQSLSVAFMPSPAIDYSLLVPMLQLDGIGMGGAVQYRVALDGDGFGNYVYSDITIPQAQAHLENLSELTLGVCFLVGTDCLRGDFNAFGVYVNDAQFTIDNVNVVPEPNALGLLALSLAALALTRRGARR